MGSIGGHHDRGVDPVEVVGRRQPRRDALDAEGRTGRRPAARVTRRAAAAAGSPRRAAVRGRPRGRPCQRRRPATATHAGADQEPARLCSSRVDRRSAASAAAVGAAVGAVSSGRQTSQVTRPDDDRQDVDRRRAGWSRTATPATSASTPKTSAGAHQVATREAARRTRRAGEHDQDTGDEERLVVVADELDRALGQRARASA